MPVIRHIAQLGNPVLRHATLPVGDPHDATLQALIEDMLVTVAEADGVGIAAPQVHESLQLFIIASRPNPRYPDAPSMEPTAMLNPELLWRSPETVKGWEGCLSVPGIRGLVPRSERIRVGYRDRGGERCERELSGFLARVFQHEFDHINGLVFLDRVESNRDLVSEREYLRLVAAR